MTREFIDDTFDLSKARRGSVAGSQGKTRITMYLDDVVLDHFRKLAASAGCGYQTLINEKLRTVASSEGKDSIESMIEVIMLDLQAVKKANERVSSCLDTFNERVVLVSSKKDAEHWSFTGVSSGTGGRSRAGVLVDKGTRTTFAGKKLVSKKPVKRLHK